MTEIANPHQEPRYKIALAMPTYGMSWGWASRGFYARATRRPDVLIEHMECETSLLAHAFNILWARALNLAEELEEKKQQGEVEVGLTHFGMLHSDVCPGNWWLDVLLEEMETHNADVVSAVIPIKDQRGLTSTGLDDPKDPFRPEYRLVMREVDALPETFSSADLGMPERALLVNTGCWLCRFDLSWATRHAFTINDTLRRGPDGKWAAEVEPEDWEFSRWAHREGLKVLATKKVEVLHRGVSLYQNRGTWGKLETDPLRSATR